MELGRSVADSELPELRRLAGELLAADAPELGVLDRIATMAAGIAARSREAARQQLLDVVADGARALFPAASSEDVRARFAQSSLDDLSSLGTLFDTAITARRAFEAADSGLRAAHERGEYAAMAPLALEADTQKNALAVATAELAARLGLDLGAAAPAPPVAPAAASEPADDPAPAAAAGEAAPPADTESPADSQPERRRIRDLIRQMRPVPGEVP